MSIFKKYQNMAIVGVLLLSVGYGVGRFLQPAIVKIKKEEVIKEVEVVKKDIVVVEKETRLPDGTIIVDRRTEDKSTESTKKDTSKKEDSVVVMQKAQYRVRGGVGFDFDAKSAQYSVGGEKRFWGPLSLGVDVVVGSSFGVKGGMVTASWEF